MILSTNKQTATGNQQSEASALDISAEQFAEIYDTATKENSATGQCLLGSFYIEGIQVEKNAEEGVKWLQKSANQGFEEAQVELAKCYHLGIGVEKNEKQAMAWRMKAAKQGDVNSQSVVGSAYLFGNGLAKDIDKAEVWLRKAAGQNCAVAQNLLGTWALYDMGIQMEMEEAVAFIHASATQGYGMAQHVLGMCHLKGRGVKADTEAGFTWLEKAADQYCVLACRELAKQYWLRYLITQNDLTGEEAIEWMHRGAELGDAICQAALGDCYLWGTGVWQDDAEGIEWLRESARQDNPIAQFWLAYYLSDRCYEYEECEGEAIQWLLEAANSGYPIAQYMLSRAYTLGEGVSKDQSLAEKWREHAFEGEWFLRDLDDLFDAGNKSEADTFLFENYPLTTFNPIQFDARRATRSEMHVDEMLSRQPA